MAIFYGIKKYWLNGNLVSLHTITVDPEGNVYAASESLGFGWMITKFDKNGEVLWNKYFALAHGNTPDSVLTDLINPIGVAWLKGKIYVCGYVFRGKDYFSFMTGLDATTGAREWQYGYKDPELTGGLFTNLSLYDTLLMATSGDHGQTVTLINPQGGVIKNIKTIFFSSYSPQVSKAVADSKGHIYMMQWTKEAISLQPYYYYATNFAEIDTSLNEYGGTVLAQYSRNYFNDAVIGSNDDFGAIGINYGYVDDGMAGSEDLNLLKTDALKNSQFCNNSNDNTYTVSENTINRLDFQYLKDSSLTIGHFADTPDYSVIDAYLQSRYTCPDYIDSCSFMSISGPVNLCNFSDVYTYRLHRNKRCILSAQWDLPTGVTVVSQTDSSLALKFPGFGMYKLSASLNSCIPVKDSLTISIVSKSHALSLGADTSICPGNSDTLHAGKDFFFYQWNDGSTDSILIAKEPGMYFVKVTDSCGNVLMDTINIMGKSLLPISIGGDRKKCNDDTLHLNAPAGYLNYKWLPDYNISSDTSMSVVVNPRVDTTYILAAEKSPGCFAGDTIRIKVNESPLINLGRDTSFCLGDSLVLNAGTGFTKYSWNTGQSIQFVTAFKAGMYSVSGTTVNGCISRDTLTVVSVFSTPKVSLNHDDKLCDGGSRVLDAGNFVSYLWNTGSTAKNITVDGTGTYSVIVKDNNNCKGTDSVIISTILPVPTGFLPADTAICSYGELLIRPLKSFKSYVWSDSEDASSITVKKAGIYWLEATDFNNCVGTDTINVIQKDCLQGFFIPNAFTPNNDGRNDIFKPMIFGRLQFYRFTIFNRFGEVVFQTTDINKGWDGTISGKIQNTESYVWVCTYQFDEEKPVEKKGTVTLVR